MIDMPSLSDAVGLRNRIIELETEVEKLKKLQKNKDSTIKRLRRKCGIMPRVTKEQIAMLVLAGQDAACVAQSTGCHKNSFWRIRKELIDAGAVIVEQKKMPQ